MSVVSLGSVGGEMLGAVGQRQRYFYQFYHGVLKINSTSRMQIMFHSQHSRLKSGVEMDLDRRQSAGYEYLCHLQEAKQWMEECIKKIFIQGERISKAGFL